MATKDLKKNNKPAEKNSATKKTKKSSINKVTLVEHLAEHTGAQKSTCKAVLEAFCDIVASSLRNKQEVSITGFGSFVSLERKARVGTNPTTGQKMNIGAKIVPKFRPGKVLKETVNGE